ncbi:putative TonB-dependent receptor BfrD [Methylophilaceae bacterium]|nr:putative TonB-dependent receptor BfrD [Methylophilaceae bacterium]
MKKTMAGPWGLFRIKPAVSAMALVFAGVAHAEEQTLVLPEIQVEDTRDAVRYNAPKSASQKFTAPLIDTPKSVTVITEDVIQDTGSRTFQDALRTTPGITFGSGEGGIAFGDRPYIRGFDAFASMYVDGLRDLGSQQREVFAIEQMEVIKGPSGAYDGRGSAGGSINIVTKQAKAGNFIAGSVGLGTDSYKRATVDGNFQLGENAAIRIVGMAHDADTAGRDHVDAERWGVMPSITLGLDTPTQFTASWYHLETDSVPDWGLPYVQNADGVPRGTPISVSKDTWYGIKGRDFQETSADIGTFKIEHAFNDDVKLRNTTRYGRTTNDYALTRPNVNAAQLAAGVVARSATPNNRDVETDTLANLTDITVNFNTGTVKHQVNAGFEISREETERGTYAGGNIGAAATTSATNPNPNVAYTPLVKNPYPTQEAETLNKSIYVFDSMELTEHWLLNAGVRHDSYRSEYRGRNATTGAVTANSEQENDESFFNYQLGVVYKIKPNANVYATWATSSSPVGLSNGEFEYAGTGIGASTADLSPERSRTIEVGTKWNVLEDLSLTAAIFRTEKTNMRVNVGATVENQGEAEVKGFELGMAGRITNKWQVFGGYTYLDAEQTKVGVDNGTDFQLLGGVQSKGKQLPAVAKNSASIWTTYDILPKLTVGGGAFYVDKVYANAANTAYVPSYVRWDAMAKYKIDKNLDLQLNIENLTDERYYSATYFRHYAIVAPGRSGFLTLNFKY